MNMNKKLTERQAKQKRGNQILRTSQAQMIRNYCRPKTKNVKLSSSIGEISLLISKIYFGAKKRHTKSI